MEFPKEVIGDVWSHGEPALFWSHERRAEKRIFWEFHSIVTEFGLSEEKKNTDFTVTKLSAVAFAFG